MDVVDNYRLKISGHEFVPIVIGGMGVDISTPELAAVACRLGGIGHISDAMSPFVCDKRYRTHFTQYKEKENREYKDSTDKKNVKFNLEHLYQAQRTLVEKAMQKKEGSGAIFLNVMEKLNMADALGTLATRLRAALDAGIDGITLSAGLHTHSMRLISDHKRLKDAMIGIIVSSVRALKIFLRSASRAGRLPDYIIVEGPLAGGHLGFGADWKKFSLKKIVEEVLEFLKSQELKIPVIPAGGIFSGKDAVEFLKSGASAVQVATRFTVTKESGLPYDAKQKYFKAREEDVIVSQTSPTGYPIRMLKNSPCLNSTIRPQCEAFGYNLSNDGKCPYIDAYWKAQANGSSNPVTDKMCLCYHFSKGNCYTCGHYVYRLKETSKKAPDGTYLLPDAEEVFKDYQFGAA